MKCLEECEFLKFRNGVFNCDYYEKMLHTIVLDNAKGFELERCNECIEEGIVGSNTINESVKKVKFRLGLIGDSFYSFKDDFETELTEIYRILKDLEEKSQND